MRQQNSLSLSISEDMSTMDENIANGISPEKAAECIEMAPNSTLLLDCRPFIAFNDNHITQATNVYCPPILKRRSNGFVSLENIVTCEKKRKLLLAGHYDNVLVYDADTVDLAQSAKDSNLYPVLKSLRQQVELSEVFFIIGGFTAIFDTYPELCAGQNGNPPIMSLAPPPKYRSCSKTGPVEILPGLYLGDSQHSAQVSTLRDIGITSLLNVSTSCKNLFENEFEYMTIPVNDNDSANLSSWFNEAIHYIDNARDNDGKILVHCQAGISRSATVCIAYLMYKNNMTLEDAFDQVRAKRGVISPNLNFMQQLLEFEKDIMGQKPYELPESVSSISTSLASVEFDFSCSSASATSKSSGAFDFSFASPPLPPPSPREFVSSTS